ncbi:MAG: MFS transporter [Alphaproteobacteria bacterium]|nr:MFS transporter [Alphaproteobacteria bacterium]
MKQINPLKKLDLACFLRSQLYLAPVLLLFYQQNGLSIADFVLFQGLFQLTGIIFEVPCGYIADITSKKNVLILAFSCFFLRAVLWLSFEGVYIVLLGELFNALSRAFLSGVYDSYIYDYLKSKNKTRRMLKECGRTNFAMSSGAMFAAIFSAMLYKHYGTGVLLALEFILTLVSILLLTTLPNPPSASPSAKTITEKFKEIKSTAIATMSNPNINLHIIYSALLFSTTSLFCWCFQPLLKVSSAPVFMFSFIYVINHALRAGFSYNVNSLKRFFGFNRLLVVTTFLCMYSFACMILSFYFKLPNVAMLSLIFVCIGIGFQLSFAIANINHIHTFAKEETRATISSVNNMLQQTISGLSLIAFKFVIAPNSTTEGLSFSLAFTLFGILYMAIFSFLLIKIYERNKSCFQ